VLVVTFLPARFTQRQLVAEAKRLAADARVATTAPKVDGGGVAVAVTTTRRSGQGATIPGQASPTGTIVADNNARDTLAIYYPAGVGGAIYNGPWNSSTGVGVGGAVADFVGNYICTGGASSGEHCGVQVQAVDQFVNGRRRDPDRLNPLSSGCGAGGLAGPARVRPAGHHGIARQRRG
jgi:hypothetical protein